MTHTYNTPGIKVIKIVTFSHDGNVQTGRWKLVTCRFFLDIPLNQYPDFGELGGTEYKTIPWPYTTPIIGGTDELSRYKISINDTMSGGNIGDTDIIDERLLVRDMNNDETGKSVNFMDLEQVRYFATGLYDMNSLLGITNRATQNFNLNLSSNYLATLPFPQYVEEFDIVNTFDQYLGQINTFDEIAWMITAMRPDIREYLKSVNPNSIPNSPNGDHHHPSYFFNPTHVDPPFDNLDPFPEHPYNDFDYWTADTAETTFPMESSVGQIFINDNLDSFLVGRCKLELNTGNVSGKSLIDTSGKGTKGLLIGDYKVKKTKKGTPMRRDSFIKTAKKSSNKDGAL